MKENTKGHAITLTITWQEWVRQPFPMPSRLLINGITRYVITDIPETEASELVAFFNGTAQFKNGKVIIN